MIINNKVWLHFLGLILGGLALPLQTVAGNSVTLRSDIYVTKNSCTQDTRSKHEVLIADFTLDKMDFAKTYLFDFVDLESGFRQKIIFKDEVYHYGPIFDHTDHLEYNTPECDQHGCRVYIFIYKRHHNLKNTIRLQLKITDVNSKKSPSREIAFPPVKNGFSEIARLPEIELDPQYDQKSQTLSAQLKPDQVEVLKKYRVQNIELVSAIRSNLNQKAYTEKSTLFSLNEKSDFTLKAQVPQPTYLSVMGLYKIKEFSFETKTVILDLRSPQYLCKK